MEFSEMHTDQDVPSHAGVRRSTGQEGFRIGVVVVDEPVRLSAEGMTRASPPGGGISTHVRQSRMYTHDARKLCLMFGR
jgi:hypothetical protein